MAEGISLGKAYVQIMPSAQGISGSITQALGGEAATAGETAGKTMGGKLAGALKAAIAAAGIGKVLQSSVTEGAALEQSIGGIETLFGAGGRTLEEYAQSVGQTVAEAKAQYSTLMQSQQAMLDHADIAYAAAGVNADKYMEITTGFAASLLQSLDGDTVKAAEIADMAMVDMADNANKMGTGMADIQNAYQGFAKQNYTMLDNLKLGYGGTKTEMERLLADAGKLSGVKYDISSLADVYTAVHVIQGELDITGTTAKEAATTISGSAASMKAAFANVLGNLALGRDITPSLNALAGTVTTFLAGNLLPAVLNIVGSLPGAAVTFVRALIPGNLAQIAADLAGQLAVFLTESLPQLAADGVLMVQSLADGLARNLPAVQAAAGEILRQLFGALETALPSILQSGIALIRWLADGLLRNLPAAISSMAQVLASTLAKIGENLPQFLQQGIELIAHLAAGLIRSLPQVVAGVSDIIGRIRAEFGQIDWGELGVNIIKGIVRGLANAAWELFSALKDVAAQALGAAKSALGIHSPSRLFRDEIGRMIPQGMAAGIEADAGQVADAAGQLAQTGIGACFADLAAPLGDPLQGALLQSRLAQSFDRADSPAAQTANVTLNVYGAQGQDVRELAEIVMDRIQSAVLRKEAAFA